MCKIFDNIAVTKIIDIVTFDSHKGRFREIENRESYGLSFCTEGQITYTMSGAKYVSDKNNAVILPKDQSYTLYGDKKGIFPVINFECADFLCDTITVIPIDNLESYMKDYEQMKSLFLFERNRAKVLSIFYNIIYRLCRRGICANNTLAPAIKYMERNYSDSCLTNSVLAEKCGISEVHFRRLFAEQFKTTPKQFVLEIRTEKAKQLLTDGILKINAVSEECGFSNPYHFARFFKEKTGLTPTEYMKQNKINKI